MIYIVIAAGLIALAAIGWWICTRILKKRNEPVEEEQSRDMEVTLQDFIRLAALNTALDVGNLILEYKLDEGMPAFYEKYREQNKNWKEAYFLALIDILGRNKREYVRNLYDNYAALSTQDILLLLLWKQGLDNKTMAQVMCSNLDTLKKRKSRLKAKLVTVGLDLKEEVFA